MERVKYCFVRKLKYNYILYNINVSFFTFLLVILSNGIQQDAFIWSYLFFKNLKQHKMNCQEYFALFQLKEIHKP